MKTMKLLSILILSLQTGMALAAPKMDSVVGTAKPLFATVLPDETDPNLYYVFPQKSSVLKDEKGKQDFLYLETRHYGWGNYRIEAAHLSLGIVPSIENPELDAKVAEIKATNPAAVFAVITAFQTSVIALSETSKTYFLSSHCPEISGPLEVPVYCELEVNPEMAEGFRKVVTSSNVAVFELAYKFYGSVRGELKEFTYSVPLRIGSLRAKGYFVDQNGDPI